MGAHCRNAITRCPRWVKLRKTQYEQMPSPRKRTYRQGRKGMVFIPNPSLRESRGSVFRLDAKRSRHRDSLSRQFIHTISEPNLMHSCKLVLYFLPQLGKG